MLKLENQSMSCHHIHLLDEIFLWIISPNRFSLRTRLLISDFGTCMLMFDQQQNLQSSHVKRTGNTGTMEYIAPELMKKDPNGEYCYWGDEKADIWSLGTYAILLKEMNRNRSVLMLKADGFLS